MHQEVPQREDAVKRCIQLSAYHTVADHHISELTEILRFPQARTGHDVGPDVNHALGDHLHKSFAPQIVIGLCSVLIPGDGQNAVQHAQVLTYLAEPGGDYITVDHGASDVPRAWR